MSINANNIETILIDFAKNKKLFLNEAQFQFELALEIKKQFPSLVVHLEYPSLKGNSNRQYSYYDIVIQEGNEFYVIELKYKTKDQVILYKGSNYLLKNHAAQDLGRFDYLNDVSRIENWQSNNQGKQFVGGCAIILTNDSAYWKNDGKGRIYEQFALKDGNTITSGSKAWIGNVKITSVGKSRINGLNLYNTYKIKWLDYCNGFKYLMLII